MTKVCYFGYTALVISRCIGMTGRDHLRVRDVQNFSSSNFTHKSCGIFVASWGIALCIGTRLVFHDLFYLNVKRTNETMHKPIKYLKCVY